MKGVARLFGKFIVGDYRDLPASYVVLPGARTSHSLSVNTPKFIHIQAFQAEDLRAAPEIPSEGSVYSAHGFSVVFVGQGCATALGEFSTTFKCRDLFEAAAVTRLSAEPSRQKG